MFTHHHIEINWQETRRDAMRIMEMERLARIAQPPKPRRLFTFLLKIWRRIGASKTQAAASNLEAQSRPTT
jgi:hypothetical protein